MSEILPRAVKISNLSLDITKEKIHEAFAIGGPIESIEIGYQEALVIFASEEAADNCLMLDNTMVVGTYVNVEKADTLVLTHDLPEVILPEKLKEEKEIPKQIVVKEEIENKCQKDMNKMVNLMNFCNVPARSELSGDDLFTAVFNKKYGIAIVGLWSAYLMIMNLFYSSD